MVQTAYILTVAVMKTPPLALSKLVVMSVVASLGGPTSVLSADSSRTLPSKSPLTYDQLVKSSRAAPPQGAHAAVGRTVRLHLKSFSAVHGEFYVRRSDEIGFVCQTMSTGFRGGQVSAVIVAHEAGADGGEFFTLSRCSTAS